MYRRPKSPRRFFPLLTLLLPLLATPTFAVDEVVETLRLRPGVDAILECLMPIPVTEEQRRSIVWFVLHPGEKREYVEYDQRVYKNEDGTLLFANVGPSDEKGNSPYVCTLDAGGRHHYGYTQYKLVVEGADVGFRKARLQWSSNETIIAGLQSEHSIKCAFSGYPTPKITWQKMSYSMTQDGVVDGFGFEEKPSNSDDVHHFVFGSLDYRDFGFYRCVGNQEIATFDGSTSTIISEGTVFRVAVAAPPHVYPELSGIIGAPDVNGTVLVSCFATGHLSPFVELLKDGVKLLSQEESKLSTRRLTPYDDLAPVQLMTRVTPPTNVSAFYLCGAINDAGSHTFGFKTEVSGAGGIGDGAGVMVVMVSAMVAALLC